MRMLFHRLFFFSIGIACLVVVGIVAFGFARIDEYHDRPRTMEQPTASKQSGPRPQHYAYRADREFYERAFARVAGAQPVDENVSGGIIPHHLLVADKIADFYLRMRNQNVKTVVLIGPNHFQAGVGNILASQAVWQTPYGTIEPEDDLISMLIQNTGVLVDEKPFEQEHAISVHVSFIKKIFPEASLVPLILKFGTTQDEIDRLANVLAAQGDEETLVLASVDFSHHLPVWVADFHDDLALSLINNFETGRLTRAEVDSPASLSVLLAYLRMKGDGQFELLHHTNAAGVLGQPDLMDTTSHVIGYYTKGEVQSDPVVSIIFFPDMMLGRNVAALSRKYGSYEYPFQKLAGDEQLFFRGFDLGVANLEGPVTEYRAPYQKEISFAFDPEVASVLQQHRINMVSLANNHGNDQGARGLEDTKKYLTAVGVRFMGHPVRESEEDIAYETVGGQTIAFIGFNLTDHAPGDEKLKEVIMAGKLQADAVFVFVHWGVEYQRYPTQEQERLSRLFIDWGADAVIGHHPHVVQTMAAHDGKLIFYSLGNFIFDQYFSPETEEGLALGVIVQPNEMKYYLIPYRIPHSQPTLMEYEERRIFLEKMAADSRLAPDLARAVESGVVPLGR